MLKEGQGRYKLLCAWNQMCDRTKGEFIDINRYAYLKEEFSKNNPSKDPHVKKIKREKQIEYWNNPENILKTIGKNNHRYGTKHTPETKRKIGLANSRPSPLKGRERPNLKGKLAGAKNPMAKAIEIEGVVYETYTQAAKEFGITVQAMAYWVKTGKAIDLTNGVRVNWTDSRTRSVCIKGVEFETISEATKHYGVSRTTIINWIKRGLGKYTNNL